MSKFLGNLNIGKRLSVGFSIILLSALLAVGLAISQLGSVADSAHQLLTDPLTTERLISDWYRVAESGTRRTLAIAKSSDPSLVGFFGAEIIASTVALNRLEKQIEPHIQSASQKQLWGSLSQARAAYLAVRGQVLSLKQAGKGDAAARLIDAQLVPIGRAYSARIEDLLNEERRQIDTMADGIQQTYLSSRTLMLALTVVLVAFVAICAWVLTTSIIRPLARAVHLARQVAAGDLSAEAGALSRDETGKLLRALDDKIGRA